MKYIKRMYHTSRKDDTDETSGAFGIMNRNSVNHGTAENVTVDSEYLDDSDCLSEPEDLSKFCQLGHDEPDPHNSYHEEWEQLFVNGEYLEKLRLIGIKGRLRNCRFRSICWRVYLECLPESKALWVSETELLRNQYEKILHKLHNNPRCDTEDMDLCLNNPLSQSEESPWNQYFQDSELKLTIQQDVSRTFPEIEFFHTPEVQEMMVNVLFCYARKYPHISYRQGMHELLAPIIFVLHSDQQAYLHASEIELLDQFEKDTRFDISVLLNPNYTEHDAFFLLCQLMETVESWYVQNESLSAKGYINFNLEPFVRDPDSSPGNALGVKLTKIYEQLLRYHDPELFNHLEQLEIVPQIYGIRWLRLLFGREFSMQDLLVIWDAIFANSLSFDLVDYIFTAMLVFIRDLLLSSDYSSCISLLMRYPAVADVHYLIDLALHLKNPVQYKKPVGYSGQILRHVPLVGGRKEIHRAPMPVASGSSDTLQSVSERCDSSRPTSLILPSGMPKDVNCKTQSLRAALNSEQGSDPGNVWNHHQPTEYISVAEPAQANFDSLQERKNSSPSSHNLAKALMANDDDSLSSSNVFHSANYSENEKTKASRASVTEMVPLVPQNIPSTSHTFSEHTLLEAFPYFFKHEEQHFEQATAQIAEMKAMTEYCGRWMTVHLDKLQACMEHQKLEDDDMLIALAGLKWVRDILNGTVSFSQEVTDDEYNILAPKNIQVNDNGNQKLTDDGQDNQIEDFVVVQENMCEGKNYCSPNRNSNKQSDINKKSEVTEPQCETDSRDLGKSFATARKKLCKLFLLSSPVTEKQNESHVNS